MARFNPPPNWPAPPQGWTPPEGWQPPASWPAPPAGWVVWVEDGRAGSSIPPRRGSARQHSRVRPRSVVAAFVAFVVAWLMTTLSATLVLTGVVAVVLGLLGVTRALAARPGQGRASRRSGMVVTGAGLAALLVGAGIGAPEASAPASAAAAAVEGGAPSPPATHASPVPLTPSPVTPNATATASPTATVTPTPTPSPVLTMTCPAPGRSGAAAFGHDISARAPYTVAIDYGDGKSYSNDDQHVAAVFSHTYARAGTYTVTARLTDAAHRTAASSCTYTWTAPVVARSSSPSSAATSAGTSGSGSSVGGGDDYYTNSDGDEVHVPEAAPAAPAGATAQCRDGAYSFSQHRSGTCSGHGGVAQWL